MRQVKILASNRVENSDDSIGIFCPMRFEFCLKNCAWFRISPAIITNGTEVTNHNGKVAYCGDKLIGEIK